MIELGQQTVVSLTNTWLTLTTSIGFDAMAPARPATPLALSTNWITGSIVIINSYSSRMRRIWADIYNQRGRIISSYPVSPRRITVLVNFQAILLISSCETSANRDVFFTDDAAKKFFPTSKISAQEIRHQFFFWSNLTIMAHIMGLGNKSLSWAKNLLMRTIA